jgi:hypothetical protein
MWMGDAGIDFANANGIYSSVPVATLRSQRLSAPLSSITRHVIAVGRHRGRRWFGVFVACLMWWTIHDEDRKRFLSSILASRAL